MTMAQNSSEIENYVKLLIFRSTQIVIESRRGEKIKTNCNPQASSNDWFNIVIHEHPDIRAETKKALNLAHNETIFNRLPLCIEISLQTVDGDKMILEVWSLELNKAIEGGKTTSTVDGDGGQTSAIHAIYNRMNILLKSLISLTRSTPAYKLSRRQSEDSYRIYYRIYVDTPQVHVHTLGEGYKSVRVGQLNTMTGVLNIGVAYRTKMTISPTQAVGHEPVEQRSGSMMLKSDHFPKDFSPSAAIDIVGNKVHIDIDKPLRHGAFVDTSKLKQYTEKDYILPEESPFSWIIRKKDGGIDCSVLTTVSLSNSPIDESNMNNNNIKNYKNFEIIDSNSKISANSPPQPIKSIFIPSEITNNGTIITKSDLSDDKNLIKELHFPFASVTNHLGDLTKFYLDCYNAPKLHTWEEHVLEPIKTIKQSTSVDELTKQLEDMEVTLEDYDKMLASLAPLKSSTASA